MRPSCGIQIARLKRSTMRENLLEAVDLMGPLLLAKPESDFL